MSDDFFAKKCERVGYPDIEIEHMPTGKHFFIEVKVQRRTFMAIERLLPNAELTPSQTMALNLSDLVLDPFGGTMTTGAMAKKLGRQYIMIERDPRYCKFGEQRLAEISFEDSPIARAQYDEKPLKVTMEEMIAAGYFQTGEYFCFRSGEPIAKLLDTGKLEYNGETVDMHSCAAMARGVKANRLNGFDVWYVIRNGNPVSIADIRDNYRKTKV